ncbi:MAG TPA: radical SAM protein, partial [Candidatus Elarobacter sp.]|nr:radical SAM protein [Candidatus Elarobacter sp.]
LTGGEPTLRADLADIARRIRDAADIDDLALSTNGVRLPALGAELRAAGVDRVNVSVDSLRPDRIAALSRRTLPFDPVAVTRFALDAGFAPVKLNTVVMRGRNDDEIGALAALTRELPIAVRFIELMPVGDLGDAAVDAVVPADEILARVEETLGTLEPDAGPARGNGPARYYRAAGAAGTVGVISPMTHTYCAACNRVRLTADGRLRTCLFGDHEVDLRTPLRAGERLEPYVIRALAEKPLEHALLQRRTGGLLALSQTGG